MGFMQISSALTTMFLTFSTNCLRKGKGREGKREGRKKRISQERKRKGPHACYLGRKNTVTQSIIRDFSLQSPNY